MRVIVFSVLLALSTSIHAKSPDLTGWWGFTPEGCNDEDNKDRVALGKWESTDQGIVFGKGTESIGMYDETCQLKNRKDSKGVVSYSASCIGEEDEKFQGTVKIVLAGNDHIKLFIPNGASEGMELSRCSASVTEPVIEPVKPKLTKNQQELIDNSWLLFTSRLTSGLKEYSEYCKTMARDTGYWRSASEAENDQAIHLCSMALTQKMEDTIDKFNKEANPEFENCREYTISRGRDWLKADDNMAVNPFEQPENEIVNFYGILKSVGDDLYVMNDKQQKVFIKKDENATLIRSDLLNVETGIRGFGRLIGIADATTLLGEKVKVKVVNAECIEPNRLIFPPVSK